MSRIETAVLLLILGVGLASVVGSTYLPMMDVSSHLATSVIVDRLTRADPFFSEHYRVLAVPVPYWATTLLTVPLLPLIGPFRAFGFLIGSYVLLLPLAFHALMRRAAPQNTPLVLVASLAAFNWAYWAGETNYLLGLPVFLFAYAQFLGIQGWRSARLWGFLVLTVVAYLCHIYILATLLIAVGATAVMSLGGAWRGRSERLHLAPAQWWAAGWLLALSLTAAYYVLVQHGTAANRGLPRFDLSAGKLAYYLAYQPFGSPTKANYIATLCFAGAVGSVLILPWVPSILRAPRQGLREALNPVLLAPALALILVTHLGPVEIAAAHGATGWQATEREVAMRFAISGLLLALGGVRLRQSRAARLGLLAAVLLFGGLKLGEAASVHRSYDRSVAEISQGLLAAIPRHSRVLLVVELVNPTPFHDFPVGRRYKIVNYVVAERESYSPHVFAVLGQQPLRHVYWGDYRHHSDSEVREADWHFYDFLLVQSDLERPQIPGLSQRASLVARMQRFWLYRIRHDANSRRLAR